LRATRYDGQRGGNTFDILSPRAVSEPTIRKQDSRMMTPRIKRSNTEIGHHVHWSDKSRVILVPSRQDYRSRGFDHDLWWDQRDYEQFKVSAKDEVIRAMESQHLDLFSAISNLYQPDCDIGNGDHGTDGNGTDDDGTEGSVRSAGSLSLDNFDANTAPGPVMKESLSSFSPSRENLSRKPSWGSESQSSTGSHSSERRTINPLELRDEKGPEERQRHHPHHAGNAEGAKRNSKRPIHPLALMAL
jgi:hypothetical protein